MQETKLNYLHAWKSLLSLLKDFFSFAKFQKTYYHEIVITYEIRLTFLSRHSF